MNFFAIPVFSFVPPKYRDLVKESGGKIFGALLICFLIMGNFSCKDSKRKVMNQVFSKENIFFFTRLIEIFVPLYHERINRWKKWRNRHG